MNFKRCRYSVSLPRLPYSAPCQVHGVGASRISRWGLCLACCLKSSIVRTDLPFRPRRVMRQQVFRGPGFQDGSLTLDESHQHQPERPMAAHMHRTQKDTSRVPLSALAFREASDLRPTRPGAPDLPRTPAALLQPHQTTALHRYYPRGQPRGRIEYLLSQRQAHRAFPPDGHVSTSPKPALQMEAVSAVETRDFTW